MSVTNLRKQANIEPFVRHKLYKSHRGWMTALVTGAVLTGGTLALNNGTVRADTTMGASGVTGNTSVSTAMAPVATAPAVTTGTANASAPTTTYAGTTGTAPATGYTAGTVAAATVPTVATPTAPQVNVPSANYGSPIQNTVNDANVAVAGAVNNNWRNYTAAGGTLTQGSDQSVNAGYNPTGVRQSLTQDYQAQVQRISEIGSFDATLASDASSVNAAYNNMGGGVVQGPAQDVTAYNSQQTASFGQAQIDKVTEVGSANATISAEVAKDAAIVSAAGGVLRPGKTTDVTKLTSAQISANASHAKAMVSATAAGDSNIISAATSAKPIITSAGGTLSQSGTINTADDMTPEAVSKSAAGEIAKISDTASMDASIMQTASANSAPIAQIGGTELPGSAIDTTNMTSEERASLLAKQTAMVNATGSADAATNSAVAKNSHDIMAMGGTLTKVGDINTANNMTPAQITSLQAQQVGNIEATGDADRAVSAAVKNNQQAVHAASGVLKPGSAIVTSNMTPAEVESLKAKQTAMVNATGSADAAIVKTVQNNQAAINRAGGTVTQSGNVNTANNMTPTQVASLEASQEAKLNAVGSGDALITSAMNNSAATAKFGGKFTTGSAMNVDGKTPKEINALAQSEAAMMSLAESENAKQMETQTRVSDVTNAVGGTVSAGSAIDLSKMTPSEAQSFLDSENATLSAVGEGNRQIGSAVTGNMNDIQLAGGMILRGSEINKAGHTVSDTLSNAASQAANVVATGSGDKLVSDTAKDYGPIITSHGGTLTKLSAQDVSQLSGSEVSSMQTSQADNIKATASGDVAISEAVARDTKDIENFGGQLTEGSVVDMSGKSASEITSQYTSQIATADQTAQGDKALSNAVSAGSAGIAAVGGSLIRLSMVNTASMSGSQVAKLADSQVHNVSLAGSADNALSAAIGSNKSDIEKNGGSITVDKSTDVAGLSDTAVASDVANRVAHINAAGDAARAINSSIKKNQAAISALGGQIIKGTPTDVTKMTPEEVESYGVSMAAHLNHTASAAQQIKQALDQEASNVAVMGGSSVPQSLDVTKMTDGELDALGASDAAWIAQAGSANVVASQAANEAKSLGATVTFSQTPANASALASLAAANASATASAVTVQKGANDLSSAAASFNAMAQSLIDSASKTMGQRLIIQRSEIAINPTLDASKTSDQLATMNSLFTSNTTSFNAAVASAAKAYSDQVAANNALPTSPNYDSGDGFTRDDANHWDVVRMGSGDITLANDKNPLTDSYSVKPVVINSKVDKSHIVTKISWDSSNAPTFVSGRNSGSDGRQPTYTTEGPVTLVLPGSTWRFHNVLTTADGQTHDLDVTFEYNGDSVDPNEWIKVWGDKDHAINAVGGALNAAGYNTNTLTMKFNVVGGSGNYLWVVNAVDMDGGQVQTISGSGSGIAAVGGGLHVTQNGDSFSVASRFDEGVNRGKNHKRPNELDGVHSAPDGAAVLYSYDSTLTLSLADQKGSPWSTGVASAYFGDANQLTNIGYPVTLPVYKVAPVSAKLTVASINPEYHVLSTQYSPVSTRYTAYSASYNPMSDIGGLTPMSTSYAPYSTSFRPLSDHDYIDSHGNHHRGYGPASYTTTPLSVTYQNYSSDGTKIPVYISDGHGGWKLNPAFTGYTPFSTTYKSFSTDGTKVPVYISDGHGGWKLNPAFTGYTPFSTTYKALSSDGTTVPAGHNFTGYTPYKATYQPLSYTAHLYHDDTPASPAGPGVGPSAGMPASPAAPAPAVASPVAVSMPAPAAPAPELPQTGQNNEAALVAFGLAISSMSLVLMGSVKKHN